MSNITISPIYLQNAVIELSHDKKNKIRDNNYRIMCAKDIRNE